MQTFFLCSSHQRAFALMLILILSVLHSMSVDAHPKPIIRDVIAEEIHDVTKERNLQSYSPTGFQQQVLDAVNKERTSRGLPNLCINKKLENAAQGHSNDMATHNYMGHPGSDESTMSSRITAAGCKWRTDGENVAGGQPTVGDVMRAWMVSPPHKSNILSSNYTMLGCGYAYSSSSTYTHYWTQDFASGPSEVCG